MNNEPLCSLELTDVDCFYDDAHVLKDVSLKVREGEIVGLIGRNGAGKTTTLKSIIGILKTAKGSIKFNDNEITGNEIYDISKMGIGYVPESREIFSSLSVNDNLEIFCSNDGRWSMQRIYELFPRLYERKYNLGDELSGGEQQMLAIGRALATNPRLLLLDEPSEGLAPIIVDQLKSNLKQIGATGMSVLIAGQNIDFSKQVCDRFYIISNGEIVWEGSRNDLLESKKVVNKYVMI